MRISIPDPEIPSEKKSLQQEVAEIFDELKDYRTARLPEEVEIQIHEVAMNLEISQWVVDKLKSDMPVAHKKFLRFCAISLGLFLLPIPISLLEPLFPSWVDNILTAGGGHSESAFSYFWLTMWLLAGENFLLYFFDWRIEYRDMYVADHLIRAIEIGLKYSSVLGDRLKYQGNPEVDRLRDNLATIIQRTAIKHSIAYRRSQGTRYFKTQLRVKTKNCRNEIMSLVPVLAVAELDEVQRLNADLARLLIRTQTGYWHQTSDIARLGTPLPRRESIRLSLASFVRDRSIQVAFIALTATLAATVIAAIFSYTR